MSQKAPCTAADIKKALATQRHTRDYFLTEVKSGSTYMGTANRILDAVALRLSWTKPYITGYEVKVTRSDYTRDNKFFTYLPLVHALYIATPTGLIQREEIPAEIGLIWYDPAKKTIRIIKKPPPRQIEVSADMLQYIIYSRLEPDRIPFYSSTAEYFREWLDNKRNNRQLAQVVRNKLVSEINRLEDELQTASRYRDGGGHDKHKELIAVMEAHGWRGWPDPAKWLAEQLTRQYPQVLDDVKSQIDVITRTIERAKETAQSDREAQEGSGDQ